MTFPLTVAAACFAGGIDNPVALAVPDAAHRRAVELVARLGERQFAEREAAGKQLEALGRLALPAVRAGKRSADAEVRKRCGSLAPALETEELAARLRVFVADAAGRFDHRVPGWELFRAAAGDTRPARDLFAAVVRDRSNWPLLNALRGPAVEVHGRLLALGGGAGVAADRPDPGVVARAVAVRRWEFHQARNPPPAGGEEDEENPKPRKSVRETLPAIALVLLAETLHSERLIPRRQGQIDAGSLLNEAVPRAALLGQGPHAPPFQQLMRAWMDTRDGDGVLVAYAQAVHGKFDGPTLDRLAARVVARPNLPADVRVECAARLAAARAVGSLGAVLRSFGDTDPAHSGQVRDVMLLTAVRLTGQTPADYGLGPTRFNRYYAVPDATPVKDVAAVEEAMRAAAFERWRDWEATHFGAAAGPLGAVGRILPSPPR